jgi:hypothetical protein
VVELLNTCLKDHSALLRRLEAVLNVWFYLQLLKYSIDYFTPYWLGREQPILVHLSASYYTKFESELMQHAMLCIVMVFMSTYWLAHFLLFRNGVKLSAAAQNVKRVLFLITKNLLYLPLLTTVLRYFIPNPASFLHPTKSTLLTTTTPASFCSSSPSWAACLS